MRRKGFERVAAPLRVACGPPSAGIVVDLFPARDVVLLRPVDVERDVALPLSLESSVINSVNPSFLHVL